MPHERVRECIPDDPYKASPLIAKSKAFVDGMKTAATPNAAACEGCGYCESACPEHAIRLERARA